MWKTRKLREVDAALYKAASWRRMPELREALAKGGRPGAVVEGETALIVAARYGYDGALHLMAACCSEADLEARDKDGWSALMHASVSLYDHGAKPLLAAGADHGASGPDGRGCVLLAASAGSIAALAALLGSGASVETPAGAPDSALAAACAAGRWECVEALLAAGAGIDDAGMSGTTALMAAVERGDAVWVSRLLVFGADPSARDARGFSGADLADAIGNPEVAALMRAAARSRAERAQLAAACGMERGPEAVASSGKAPGGSGRI
jgi:ankyrin repeat protein